MGFEIIVTTTSTTTTTATEVIWTKRAIGAQGRITLLNLCYLMYVLILFCHRLKSGSKITC